VLFVVVGAVVVGTLQCGIVLGSGDGVAMRGGVIIVSVCCADRSPAKIRVIRRCRKGNFSTSAATAR